MSFSPFRQLQLNSVNNMAWRVKPEEVLIEVGKLFGSKVGLQKLNYEVIMGKYVMTYCENLTLIASFSSQNFSLTQFGVNSGRGSIISCGSAATNQPVPTIGVFKGERVAIKKIPKKKVSLRGCHVILWSFCEKFYESPNKVLELAFELWASRKYWTRI